MQGGAALHLEHRYGGPRWYLSSGGEVHPGAARLVIRDPNVVANDDALFVDMLAQTFRYVEPTPTPRSVP
jgi:hypothetical protein